MRYCPNCGTEVDETAVFCPTCGQPIDQAAEAEMPAAPAWPEPGEAEADPGWAPRAPEPQRAEPPAFRAAPPEPVSPAPIEDQTRVERQPDQAAAPPPPGARGGPPADVASSRGPAIDLPVTMPVTLSGWLIGIGAILAAIGIVIGLFDGFLNPIELILLLALIAIAAAVFFSGSLPAVPNLRLITLVVALIGFGIALDRIAFVGAGVGELLLFLGTAAAAMGAILLELGRDQPLGSAR